jgi:hypothetical protein
MQLSTIDSKDFTANYYPWLMQDLIAARDYLDIKSDNSLSTVNRDHLIVIGAEEGAALGCLWLASECHRFAAAPRGGVPGGVQLAAESEAGSVAGAIWLTPAPVFGWPRVKVEQWLAATARLHPIPMVFVFGEKDAAGSTVSRRLMAAVKSAAPGHPMATEEVIPATASSGVQLLAPDQEGIAAVRRQVQVLLKAAPRPRPGVYRETNYYWSFPGVKPPVQAKVVGQPTPQLFPLDDVGLHFDRGRPGR